MSENSFTEVFTIAERAALDFLELDYGFSVSERRVVGESGTAQVLGVVTYQEILPWYQFWKNRRIVSLSVAPLRLELDLEIGFGTDRRNRFAIQELHGLEGQGEFPLRQHNLYETIEDAQKLQEEFKRLAEVLRDCGERFFCGDPSLWHDLRAQRQRYNMAERDALVSREADHAFKSQQWARVIALLEETENRLGKLDRSRLHYARKKMTKSS